jgi:hypothetical protein
MRVLRGGSWNNNRNNARCAYRLRLIPDHFNNNLGFRVVCSHAFCLCQQRQPVCRLQAAEAKNGPPGSGLRFPLGGAGK